MQDIIDAVSKDLLLSELTPDIFIRKTNKSENEIYIFQGADKPNLLNEVGRLREISFRLAGGGTGKPVDLDEYDRKPNGYYQLIVWNPEDQNIVGGYRFVFCKDVKDEFGNYDLSTTEILDFSETIKNTYFPYTIELGRSFVQPEYQPSKDSRKGLFSLDNLWDGLGALIVDNPEMRYFFGKITMYRNFNQDARNMILDFMDVYFPDNEGLVKPRKPIIRPTPSSDFLSQFNGLDFKAGYNLLTKLVREKGETIPPLFNSYMSLSPTMKTFGTSINEHFGYVEETGIMVTIDDIYPEKKDRHVSTYSKN